MRRLVYNWDMRELSAVFQGLTLARRELNVYAKREAFVRLWLHECARVFSDRLLTAPERKRYAELSVPRVVARARAPRVSFLPSHG